MKKRDFAEFGSFRLFASERHLVREGATVALGSRALDILIALVDGAGRIVTKQELLARVWYDLTVDDSSLRVHMAHLRKALGDGQDGSRYIETIPGRGYSFVAQVRTGHAASDKPDRKTPIAVNGLPRRSTPVVGREDDVGAISELLALHRFVTIHGPGGIGKTTAALTIANEQHGRFDDGVHFLDLGLLGSDSVPEALSTSLGLMVQSSDPTANIVNFLRERRMLLVFDCCEHVVDSAAALAESIFQQAPSISILATSRERLRAEGERVYLLAPLEVPPEGSSGNAEKLMSYEAARLFMERAAASGYQHELSDADASIVADICRKLEGNALALELAAGRVGTHGLTETSTLLGRRLNLLWQGRRTAPPRQQTLNATLDWSHQLLSEAERAVLRRLSVFVGPFSLRDAQSVAADSRIGAADIDEALGELVSKSLVSLNINEGGAQYRLLDMTRSYAQRKLVESEEAKDTAFRHALHYQATLAQFAAKQIAYEADSKSFAGGTLANILAALAWSFSDAGDKQLAIQLAASSVQLLLELSLFAECQTWCSRAIQMIDEDIVGTSSEMALHGALAQASMFMRGNNDEAFSALNRALQIAENIKDYHYQFRLLCGLHMYHRRRGDFSQLLPIAKRASAMLPYIDGARTTAAAHGMMGVSYHLTGDLMEARIALNESLRQPVSPRQFTTRFFGSDRDAKILISRTLWQLGLPDQAVVAAMEAERVEQKDPVTACLTLIGSASLFHLCGKWDLVENSIDQLLQHAREHSLDPYKSVGLGFQGEIVFRRGDIEAGMNLIREAISRLRAERYDNYTPWLSCTLAEGLAARGYLDQALALMNELVAAADRASGVFNLPELLRVFGEIMAQAGNEEGADRCFERSLALADQQAALSWRLRTVTSLARLRIKQGRHDEGHRALVETYARFTEGFDTLDLRSAKLLIDG